MPLKSISKDSEVSNSPKPSRTSRTLQQLDADNVILILKQKLLLDLENKVTIEVCLIQGARWKYSLCPVNFSFCAVLSLILSKP